MTTGWRAELGNLLICFLLIVVAFGLNFTVGLGQSPKSTLPVDLPVAMDRQWTQAKSFRPWVEGSYRASLKLTRRFPHREMECLADVGSPFAQSTESGRRTDCPAGFPPTVIEWVVLEDGRPMVNRYGAGPHGGEYSGAFVGRTLGWFELRRFHAYVVQFRIANPNPNLAATNPRFQLGFDDLVSVSLGALLVSAVALVLGVIGLIRLVGVTRRIAGGGELRVPI